MCLLSWDARIIDTNKYTLLSTIRYLVGHVHLGDVVEFVSKFLILPTQKVDLILVVVEVACFGDTSPHAQDQFVLLLSIILCGGDTTFNVVGRVQSTLNWASLLWASELNPRGSHFLFCHSAGPDWDPPLASTSTPTLIWVWGKNYLIYSFRFCSLEFCSPWTLRWLNWSCRAYMFARSCVISWRHRKSSFWSSRCCSISALHVIMMIGTSWVERHARDSSTQRFLGPAFADAIHVSHAEVLECLRSLRCPSVTYYYHHQQQQYLRVWASWTNTS